jgi:hypothetical protein
MSRPGKIGLPATAGLVLWVALVPVAFRLAVLPWTGVPQPVVHDEFSYVLAADTFAAGRLANPPHPLWEHFEALHVLQQPTYASKYFPGQGLVLGLGQAIGGHPWVGVLIGMALALGSTAWMLRGWLPWPWAVLGAGLFALRYLPGHYWWNSYWGGGLPAACGALLLGGLPRLLRRPSVGVAVTAGLGLAVLLLTRPNEALWLAVPSAVMVWLYVRRAYRARRDGTGARGWLASAWPRRVLVAGALTLVPVVIFTGIHNRAVTGNPLTLPYMLYERTSGAWPFFKWDRPRPLVVHRHEAFRQLDQWWAEYRQRSIQPRGILRQARLILDLPTRGRDLRATGNQLTRSVFGVLLLLSLPWAFRDRRMRIPLVLAGAAFIDLNQILIYFEHYGAPWAGLRVLLIARAAERASTWWRWKRRRGLGARRGRRMWGWAKGRAAWVVGVPACCVLAVAAAYQAAGAGRPVDEERRIEVDRPAIVAELARHPGQHVVLVRYDATHDFHQHWVYNAADIDRAPIVWAWEMGPKRDRELFEYFAGRSFWLLEPDVRPPRLTPLGTGKATSGPPPPP